MSLPDRVAKYQPLWSVIPGQVGLPDPFLVAAIGDRESGWGEELEPQGPAGLGDEGHGHGLMQIDDRSWGTWLQQEDQDGQPLWTCPGSNIDKGCRILLASWQRFKTYTFFATPLSDAVIWMATIAAYNAGQARIETALTRFGTADAEAAMHCLDLYTTGANYVTDVVRRWAVFKLGLGTPFTLDKDGMHAIGTDQQSN